MKNRIISYLKQQCSESPLNCRQDGGQYFDQPLIGFAAANDPLFEDYKQAIGPFHRSPNEWLNLSDNSCDHECGTVISWILPISKEVRISNRGQQQIPSKMWAHTRNFGEQFNADLRREVVNMLQKAGHVAIAPQLSSHWQEVDVDGQGPSSCWSERHAAYAAGLGTFSLNDGLITECGIAHRCGSVVTDLVLPPSPRQYSSHTQNCPYCREKKCGACIARCPVDALSVDGHDKIKCRAYTYWKLNKQLSNDYGVDITGCGLCQTRVPCESAIPNI